MTIKCQSINQIFLVTQRSFINITGLNVYLSVLCVWKTVNSAEAVFVSAPQYFLEKTKKKHRYGIKQCGGEWFSFSRHMTCPSLLGNLKSCSKLFIIQALFLLLQCGYNMEEALRRKRMNAVPPADTMSLWSEEECRAFETGLRVYGKDFYNIQNQKVGTRAVGELVQFYYLWKKTERHDVFANSFRIEKKKYTLHPGTTDYMER